MIGGSLPAALAADWLTSAWDQNAALYACGPAAAVVEEVVGAWLKEILGIPGHASFALVSGCQMAHATCLAAARHRLLSERGWDVERQGLFGAAPIRILSSGERHGSIERAVRLLGLGSSHVIELPTDARGSLQSDALERACIDWFIFSELVYNRITPEARSYILEVIERLRKEGCDAVGMLCAELPLLLRATDTACQAREQSRCRVISTARL